ncbi:hypothetical protein GCM10020001_112710 [Nonomuraea salmonea]
MRSRSSSRPSRSASRRVSASSSAIAAWPANACNICPSAPLNGNRPLRLASTNTPRTAGAPPSGTISPGPYPSRRNGESGYGALCRSASDSGSPRVNTSPASVADTPKTVSRSSSPPSPSTASAISDSFDGSGSNTWTRSASLIWRARAATTASTWRGSAPDSRLVVTSEEACSHVSRRRDSSYRRAFSTATPAAVARAMTMASSSSSNSPPPRFSVR